MTARERSRLGLPPTPRRQRGTDARRYVNEGLIDDDDLAVTLEEHRRGERTAVHFVPSARRWSA